MYIYTKSFRARIRGIRFQNRWHKIIPSKFLKEEYR